MRRATTEFGILHDGDNLRGIQMGHGWCAEHERGIAGLAEKFGVEDPTGSLNQRGITKRPHSYAYLPDFGFLTTDEAAARRALDEDDTDYSLRLGDDKVAIMWDEHDFTIRMAQEWSHRLRELHNAFVMRCISVTLHGPNNPLERNAFCLRLHMGTPH